MPFEEGVVLQGYLAYRNTPPVGPYSSPMVILGGGGGSTSGAPPGEDTSPPTEGVSLGEGKRET